MRGLGTSFLVRRATSTWLLLACVAVTVLAATVLAGALWTFEAASIPQGTQVILAASRDRTLAIASPPGQPIADDPGTIRAALRRAWPGVGFQLEQAEWSAPIRLPSPGGNSAAAQIHHTVQIQAAALDGIRAQAVLTAGTWPGPPRPGAPLPVALPVLAARQLNLTPGSVLTVAGHARATAHGLRVTGLFRPRNSASPYWTLDLLPASGIRITQVQAAAYGNVGPPVVVVSYGPAVVSPAAFRDGLATNQASWFVLPQVAAMARGKIGALAQSTSHAVTHLTVSVRPYGLNVTTGLPQELAGIASTIVLARSLFTISALQLLLVTAAGLALTARLLAGHREEESALLRARGATKWQVARPVLAEALVLGVVAGAAGVLAGGRLAGALAGLARPRVAGHQVTGIVPLAWATAFAVLALCVAVLAWPALRSASPDAARHGRTRPARLARIASAGGDVAVVALAVISVWELRTYSAVAHPGAGTLGIDPVVAVAPALALAGGALVLLRALPLLARLADKATERGRRLAVAMVSWQVARRPIRQAGPALLAVVAIATSTLALAGYASWHRSAADQAAYLVGADVRLDSQVPAALGTNGTIAGAPGVTAATPASVTVVGNGSQVVALDAATAGATILRQRDLSLLAPLWRRITPRRPAGLPIPGQPARLEILVKLGTLAAAQGGFGGAGVIAWVQDGGGGTYQMGTCQAPIGFLPADGRQHALIIPLAGPGQASSGLRLLGLSLCYTLPPFGAAHPPASPALRLRVLALATARTPAGPFGPPFTRGAALASWRASASSQYVPAHPPGAFGTQTPQDGTPPVIQHWHGAAAGSQQLDFLTGHAPSPNVIARTSTIYAPTPITGQVTIMARPPFPVTVPAIATNSYLSGNHVRIGSTVSAALDGSSVVVRIVASVPAFPATSPASRVVITDLAAVQDLLATEQALPLPVTRWWLRTSHGRVPRRLPPGLSVLTWAGQDAALLHDPLSAAPRQAMLAIGAATVLLAALGFAVSVAASVRVRRTQSAVFAALGVGRRAQAGHLCLEQLMLGIPAAVAGLAVGIGVARLMIPPITLTADAAAPVPLPLVVLPLGPAIVLALIIVAVPVAAAALSIARRPDPAAQLRAEAG